MRELALAERRWLSGRWLALLVAVGALLLLAFYSVTDTHRLATDPALAAADFAGYAICHRISGRSFTIAGRQLPLCARCTGIYLGIVFTFAALLLAGRGRHAMLPPLPILLVLVGLVGFMGLDGLNSYSHFFPGAPHLYQPRNWLRLVTGMGAGLAMGAIVLPAMAQTLWWDQEPQASVGNLRELAGLFLLVGVVILLVLSNQPVIVYVLALTSAAGVVMVLAAINSMFLLILLRRDARAERWSQAAAPLLVGLALAIGQVALISWARYGLTGTMTGFPGLP